MSNGSSVTVPVTITGSVGGGPVQISVPSSQQMIACARGARGSTPPTIPIIWQVASGSSANAKITNVVFPDPSTKTPPSGKSWSTWTQNQPTQQGNNWMVNNKNDNNGTTNLYYGYNITAQIGNDSSTSNTLDPGIDNQPPSP
jgi:hypothetical protein